MQALGFMAEGFGTRPLGFWACLFFFVVFSGGSFLCLPNSLG